MRISTIKLDNFKRFKDLEIRVPQSARLVIVTGANGSGKSGILEAMNQARRRAYWGFSGDTTYFNKFDENGKYDQTGQAVVNFHDPVADIRDSLWVRSAYRHEADFNNTSIGAGAPPRDDAGVERLTQAEALVSTNHGRLLSTFMSEAMSADRVTPVGELRDRVIGKIQQSLANVFGDLQLNNLVDPTKGNGTFYFTKGSSAAYPYKNLSAGERAGFDLLLDMTMRVETFRNTVFAIDEPELHLGSRVQGRLLDQLLALLPVDCQLWVATHSPGMMKRAMELHTSNPDEVVFFDTHGYDFDSTCVMGPTPPDHEFWRRSLEVALDDISQLVAPSTLVLCEGSNLDDGMDATCYRAIFSANRPGIEFLSVGNSHEVKEDTTGIAAAVSVIAPGTEVVRVVDRDEQSDSEVAALEVKGTHVLSRRNIEGFLYDEEVIRKLLSTVDHPDAVDVVLAKRRQLIADSIGRGNREDDLKKIAPNMRAELQRAPALRRSGSSIATFNAEVLAPLITKDMQVYKDLERDIFQV